MARVTVEDCIVKVPNRFDLVMMSAQRAREVSAGAPMTLDRDNDKNPVVALREIAAESVELDALKESLVRGLQRHSSIEEEEAEDVIELMAGEQELANVDRGEPAADYEGEAGDEPVVNYADADEVSEDDPGDEPLAQADDVAEDALAPDDMAEPGGDDLT